MRKLFVVFFLVVLQTSCYSQGSTYDVVIYGATPSGIAAAVNAADGGVRVALFEPTDHIGGLTSGGLSNTDFQSFESLGGTWRDFMNRVVSYYKKTYGPHSQQVKDSWRGAFYEPKVAEKVFRNMLAEHKNIDIYCKYRLQHVFTRLKNKGGQTQLTKARFIDLDKNTMKEFTGKVFIDASYEGDLMAAAGVRYTIGSEGPAKYEESAATPRDWHVQCYNYRVTLTKNPANSLPIPKPKGYDPSKFNVLLRGMQDGSITKLDDIVRGPLRQIPNEKADFNDSKGSKMSTKICNETDVWPEGSPEVRREVALKAKRHTLALFYFLQHNLDVLPNIRQEMEKWNLPKDEFKKYGHFPPVIYVREGRRMVGEYVYTQKDAQRAKHSVRAPAFKNSVAIGDYSLNSHGTYYTCDRKLLGNLSASTVPYQIPYGVMLSQKVDGLLVPVAVSASRVGFGAIRMEPIWTALGQAAGLAAAQAVKKGRQVRDIDVTQLQSNLHKRGALTFYTSDVPPSSPYFAAVQYLGNLGLFQDLIDPASATDWSRKDLGKMVQWTGPYPYHNIQPNKAMCRKLAQKWLNYFDMDGFSLFEKADQMSRGKFLNTLYGLIKKDN